MMGIMNAAAEAIAREKLKVSNLGPPMSFFLNKKSSYVEVELVLI